MSVFEFVSEGGERFFRRAAAGARVPGNRDGRFTENRSMLRFDHHRLDAFMVARDALRAGDAIARQLPRGYGTLADQLRRSVLSAYLGIAEASSRSGADRLARFRCARGEASEAAAALEAVQLLRLAPDIQTDPVLALLDRLCAMLTRLARLTRHDEVPVSDTPAGTTADASHSPPSDTNSNSLTLTPAVPVRPDVPGADS